MSTRKSSDSTSQNGVGFQAGSGSTQTVRNVNYSQQFTDSVLIKNGAFNGHTVEVWADNSVYDTVTGAFLFPGRDYNVADLHRR